jgi:hypothetical protein
MQDNSKNQSGLNPVTSHLPTKTLHKAQSSVLTVVTCAAGTASATAVWKTKWSRKISGCVRWSRPHAQRGCRGTDPDSVNPHTRSRRSVSCTLGRFILYPGCPLNRWLGARHSRSRHFGQVKPLVPARIRTLDRPESSLITTQITTIQLHLELRGGDKYWT